MICFVFSNQGVPICRQLRMTWPECRIYAPRSLAERNSFSDEIESYDKLSHCVAAQWASSRALIFIGAAGIAVRAIAPCISHKSNDPAVVVIDAGGRFVISLLSGHWGGGNRLARQLAQLLKAIPVITTASDSTHNSLDILLKEAGLHILDWEELPAIQGAILEKRTIDLYDPFHILPEVDFLSEVGDYGSSPCVAIHWRKLPRAAQCVRVALPVLHLGIGFRKNISASQLDAAITALLQKYELPPASLAAIATIEEKAADPDLIELTKRRRVELASFPASVLSTIPTPNTSIPAGNRFGTLPFSVCESAALASALRKGPAALLISKTSIDRCITIAIALEKKYL